jgi:hypothetical protein
MDMATVPSLIWSEARIYAPTAYNDLVEALMVYHESIESDDKATLIWHATGDAILLVYVYCSPTESPAIFAPFLDVPFVQTFVPAGNRTVYELVQAVASVISPEPKLYVLLSSPFIPHGYNLTQVRQANQSATNSAQCHPAPRWESTKQSSKHAQNKSLPSLT